jgi:hypothetical protein
MIKNLLLISVVVSTVVLGGCSNSSNQKGQPRPQAVAITQESIIGKWRPKYAVADGKTFALSAMDWTDSESPERLLYEVDKTEIRLLQDGHKMALKYRLEKDIIVTIDTDNLGMPDYKIIKLTSNSIQLRPLPELNEEGKMEPTGDFDMIYVREK